MRKPHKVFLIEDDDDHASLFLRAAHLSSVDADVRHFLSYPAMAEELVSLNELQWPQVIFMDQMMPMLNGTEATALLKKDAELQKIPVVVLTTSASERDRKLGYDAGCNSYISKPMNHADYNSMIDCALRYWCLWNKQ